jgi:tetratricopeptide (TPR) repeat protein
LYVELRGLSPNPAAPVEVLGRFLRALRADAAPLPDDLDERVDLFRTAIAARRMLLVLDDAADEAQVRPLLPGGSSCAVLVTSRSRLPGLAGGYLVELDTMPEDEATALLARVAGAQRIADAPGAAAQIVARCGYLPLAVRIAGARLAARRQWSAPLLAARLADEQHRLDELQVGDQQLRATIELSYRALPVPAQVALRRLGRLGYGGFPSWVIAALTGTTVGSAAGVAEQLVDAHLVAYAWADDAGRVRYRMHDLVRIFAAERAAREETPADHVEAMARVAEGWWSLVERLAAELPPATLPHRPHGTVAPPPVLDPAAADQAVADPRGWLAMEQEALVVAVEQAAALGLHQAAVRLASALCGSLFPTYNLLDCWSRTHTAALAAARAAGDVAGEAVLLAELGQLCYEQDKFPQARAYLSQALMMFRDAGDVGGEAATLTALGLACREQGYLPEAHHFLSQAEALCQALGDDRATGHCARVRASVHLEQGNFAAARADLATALAAYERIGSRRGEALTLRTVGLVHRATGELDQAEEAFRSALAIFESIGDELLQAYSQRALAKTWLRQGYTDKALTSATEALDACRALGDRWGQALTLRTLGETHLAAGRLDDAEAALTAALDMWSELAIPLQRARTLRDLATLYRVRGDDPAGRAAHAEAVELFRVHGAREYLELTNAA